MGQAAKTMQPCYLALTMRTGFLAASTASAMKKNQAYSQHGSLYRTKCSAG